MPSACWLRCRMNNVNFEAGCHIIYHPVLSMIVVVAVIVECEQDSIVGCFFNDFVDDFLLQCRIIFNLLHHRSVNRLFHRRHTIQIIFLVRLLLIDLLLQKFTVLLLRLHLHPLLQSLLRQNRIPLGTTLNRILLIRTLLCHVPLTPLLHHCVITRHNLPFFNLQHPFLLFLTLLLLAPSCALDLLETLLLQLPLPPPPREHGLRQHPLRHLTPRHPIPQRRDPTSLGGVESRLRIPHQLGVGVGLVPFRVVAQALSLDVFHADALEPFDFRLAFAAFEVFFFLELRGAVRDVVEFATVEFVFEEFLFLAAGFDLLASYFFEGEAFLTFRFRHAFLGFLPF
mmetsp:Transcript_13914/g.17504  ORF Transcript_13914/g.17504 Transcript_13914/m.17504 type:complete len:341 (-) Transcript_13914:830-1852(-)